MGGLKRAKNADYSLFLSKNQVRSQFSLNLAPHTPVDSLKRLSALKYPLFGTFGLKIGQWEGKYDW